MNRYARAAFKTKGVAHRNANAEGDDHADENHVQKEAKQARDRKMARTQIELKAKRDGVAAQAKSAASASSGGRRGTDARPPSGDTPDRGRSVLSRTEKNDETMLPAVPAFPAVSPAPVQN